VMSSASDEVRLGKRDVEDALDDAVRAKGDLCFPKLNWVDRQLTFAIGRAFHLSLHGHLPSVSIGGNTHLQDAYICGLQYISVTSNRHHELSPTASPDITLSPSAYA
jgi:hypothetical protein